MKQVVIVISTNDIPDLLIALDRVPAALAYDLKDQIIKGLVKEDPKPPLTIAGPSPKEMMEADELLEAKRIKTHKMSAAGRLAISRAMKKRWRDKKRAK